MKKLIISGSSKLYERALYWRGYFEGRGYDVIDWPCPITDDPNTEDTAPTPGFLIGRLLKHGDDSFTDRTVKTYKRFWRNLDRADAFFLMNEDKDGIEGYIGPSAFSELSYVVMGNLNHSRSVDITILKMPEKSQACYDEIKFWYDQGWISTYRRPTGRKSLVPISETSDDVTTVPDPENPPLPVEEQPVTISAPTSAKSPKLLPRHTKFTDIRLCKKKCLKPLTIREREYLSILCPDFPTWLLRYIAAPEMQRLTGVSMLSGIDHGNTFSLIGKNNVFCHSIGVALIIWRFTHDQRQTLAGLFHDIAAPSFKHTIDYLNGDSETQESIETRTSEIIRKSRVITRALKRDGILVSEVADYHVYPIADNDTPRLAADRLEYTLSNGYFCYGTWTLSDISRFYNDLAIYKNEDSLDEIGFGDADLAAEFTERSLPLFANYHSNAARASQQFLADMIRSMMSANLLNQDDLYAMNEQDIVDWILSCGDHTLSDAFRNFQRATSVYAGSTPKKNTYYTTARAKVRYIIPLAETNQSDESGQPIACRITDFENDTSDLLNEYLEDHQSKYVGFDFDFRPYSE